MSLILKGIDMPKGTDGLSITFHSQDGVTETHILDVTQAVQIPKGHGRLIDVDRLIRDEVEHLLYHLPNGDTAIPRVDIDNAPTILEAEKE